MSDALREHYDIMRCMRPRTRDTHSAALLYRRPLPSQPPQPAPQPPPRPRAIMMPAPAPAPPLPAPWPLPELARAPARAHGGSFTRFLRMPAAADSVLLPEKPRLRVPTAPPVSAPAPAPPMLPAETFLGTQQRGVPSAVGWEQRLQSGASQLQPPPTDGHAHLARVRLLQSAAVPALAVAPASNIASARDARALVTECSKPREATAAARTAQPTSAHVLISAAACRALVKVVRPSAQMPAAVEAWRPHLTLRELDEAEGAESPPPPPPPSPPASSPPPPPPPEDDQDLDDSDEAADDGSILNIWARDLAAYDERWAVTPPATRPSPRAVVRLPPPHADSLAAALPESASAALLGMLRDADAGWLAPVLGQVSAPLSSARANRRRFLSPALTAAHGHVRDTEVADGLAALEAGTLSPSMLFCSPR